MVKENNALVVTESSLLFKALEGIADQKYLMNLYLGNMESETLELISFAYKSQYIIVDLDGPDELLFKAARCLHYTSGKCFLVGITENYSSLEEKKKLSAYLRIWEVLEYELGGLVPLFEGFENLDQRWNTPNLLSKIGSIGFADILQLNEGNLSPKIISVSGEVKGCVVLDDGKPQMAWSSGRVGVEAIYELLSLKEAEVRIVEAEGVQYIENIYFGLHDILLSYCVADDSGGAAELMGEPEDWVASYLHLEDVIADTDIHLDEVELHPYIKEKSFEMKRASCRMILYDFDEFIKEKKEVVDQLLIIYDFSSLNLVYQALGQELLLGAEEVERICKLEWFDEVSGRTLCYWLVNEQAVNSNFLAIPTLIWVGSKKLVNLLNILNEQRFRQAFLLLPQTEHVSEIKEEIEKRYGHFCGIFGELPQDENGIQNVFEKINNIINEYT